MVWIRCGPGCMLRAQQHHVEAVIERLVECATGDQGKQWRRRHGNNLRELVRSLEPSKQPVLVVGAERTDVAQDERTQVFGGKLEWNAGLAPQYRFREKREEHVERSLHRRVGSFEEDVLVRSSQRAAL